MELHEALGIDLAAMNEQFIQVVESDPDLPPQSPVIHNIIQLIRAGGKRLRPMMVTVGGRFGPVSEPDQIMKVSAMLEYLHMASLIHDDIIDEADLRRSEPTLHTQTSVPEAIHTANYMMARSFEWATESDGDEESIAERLAGLASMITELCLGEYQQLHNRFNYDLTLDQYLLKTRNKTALLMANCFESGAQLTQADEETCSLLYEFGDSLGMAFQIRDDMLDYNHTVDQIGKPAGSDLRNGNVTLPVLYALENPSLSADIRSLNAESSEKEFQFVVERIAQSDAMDRTLLLSHQYMDKARAIIEQLKHYEAHKDLQVFLDYFMK